MDEHTLTTIISVSAKKIRNERAKYIKTTYGMGYRWIMVNSMTTRIYLSRHFEKKIVAGTHSLHCCC